MRLECRKLQKLKRPTETMKLGKNVLSLLRRTMGNLFSETESARDSSKQDGRDTNFTPLYLDNY